MSDLESAEFSAERSDGRPLACRAHESASGVHLGSHATGGECHAAQFVPSGPADDALGRLALIGVDGLGVRQHDEQVSSQFAGQHLELTNDEGFVDIVERSFDAGVRMGESVHKDMVAMPLGGPVTVAVVASHEYLQRFPAPRHPDDLESACP